MKYARLVLSGTYAETAPQTRSLLNASSGPVFRFDHLLLRVEHILAHKEIGRVLVDQKLNFSVRLSGGLEAVRRQLERLTAAGKELFYYARGYDSQELYLASACAKRIVHPLGSLRFGGRSLSFLFYHRLLENHAVDVTVVRRGRFKSAGDAYRIESLDDSNREQYEAVLDSTMREMTEKIRSGFRREQTDIEELLGGKILGVTQAVDLGWLDRSCSLDALIGEWKKEKIGEAVLKRIGSSFGRGKRLVVLVFEGAIIDGESRRDPALGQMVGSDSFIREVERLTKNRRIKGVVLRINSPGGSATASEEISSALARLAEKKPIVVSMGPVAGSGGYWLACAGERIYAERMTLTGSIGVISMLISARAGLERFGVTESTLRRGEFADLGSPFRPVQERDREILDAQIDWIYQSFLDRVAGSRKRSSEEIRQVAEGRVWSGSDAVEQGLVDAVGSLTEAIGYLKEKLRLKRAAVQFLPVVRYSLVQRFLMRNAAGSGVSLSYPSTLAGGLAALAGSLIVTSRGAPLAIAPEALVDPW